MYIFSKYLSKIYQDIEKEEIKLCKENDVLSKEHNAIKLKWETAKTIKTTCSQNIREHSQLQKNISHYNTSIQKLNSAISNELNNSSKFAPRISAGNVSRLNTYKDLLVWLFLFFLDYIEICK